MSPQTESEVLTVTRDKPWRSDHFVDANIGRTIAEGIVDTLREPLLVLDRQLQLVTASRAFCTTFKLDIDDILGRPIYELGNGEWNIPQLRVLLGKIIPEHGAMENYEVQHDFPSLGRRTMLLSARQIFDSGALPTNIFLNIEDVTSRRLLEREHAELLREKDILLDEAYHRVANSLQIVASIITLKAGKVTSDDARRYLEDTRDRVISVAAVQRHLHASAFGGPISPIAYLKDLCQAIGRSIIRDDDAIKIEVRGQGGNVSRKKAESFGLIVTELVTNSLKHAFGVRVVDPRIVVTFDALETEWTLSVSDNGRGAQKPAIVGEGGLGAGIVAALARQLNAQVVTKSGPEGTSVSLTHRAVETG